MQAIGKLRKCTKSYSYLIITLTLKFRSQPIWQDFASTLRMRSLPSEKFIASSHRLVFYYILCF